MKKKLIISLVVVFAALGFFIGPKLFKGSDHKSLREAKVERGDINVTILATGTVQPENRLEIKPPVAGRVEQVLVSEGQKVKKGQVLAWMSSTERAALVDSARAQGPEELKRWEEMYKPTPIVAPIAGMIILKNVESGQSFTTNDAVLVMSNRLTVKAQVDETDLAQIKSGQSCDVHLDSYPDQNIKAKVDQIAYEAKTVSNVTTYLVEIMPEQTPEFMRSGMTANVTFYVDTKKQILLVPTEFIKFDNDKTFLNLKVENGKPAEQEVQLGVSDGKRTEILSGVDEGDVITLKMPSKDGKGKNSNPFSPMGNRARNGGGGRR